jgi:hypothetical protein
VGPCPAHHHGQDGPISLGGKQEKELILDQGKTRAPPFYGPQINKTAIFLLLKPVFRIRIR